MDGLAEIIGFLIRAPFVIVFYAFKLIVFIIVIIALLYYPIPTAAILLGYFLIVIAKKIKDI